MQRTLITVIFLSVAAATRATIWGFSAPIIDGWQEVPPRATSAYGTASFIVNDVTWQTAGSVNVWGISPVQISGMHLHEASFGVNGPIRFNIGASSSTFNAGSFWVFAFDGVLNLGSNAGNLSFLNQMIAGNAYVNVHTPQFPGGEIRGQVNGVVPEPATIAVLGIGLVPFLRKLHRRR